MRILLITLMLAGCNTFSAKPVNDEAHIKWIRYDSIVQLKEVIGRDVLGASYVDLITKECTIHSLNPRGLDDERTCTLGHEVKHCFDGKYHD